MKTSMTSFIAQIVNRQTDSVVRLLPRLSPLAKRVTCASVLAIASASAGATCVPSPNGIGGTQLPFTLTTVNLETQAVSYTSGLLNNDANRTQWNGSDSQLFSDRTFALTTCPEGELCNPLMQPFDAKTPDSLGVSVHSNDNVVLTLRSWGGGTIQFTGKCDETTNIFYGFGSYPPYANNALFAFTFGNPITPPN